LSKEILKVDVANNKVQERQRFPAEDFPIIISAFFEREQLYNNITTISDFFTNLDSTKGVYRREPNTTFLDFYFKDVSSSNKFINEFLSNFELKPFFSKKPMTIMELQENVEAVVSENQDMKR
jgi:hypothetical protein